MNSIFAPYEAPKAYVNPYEDVIKTTLDKILSTDYNKPYDVTTDPLYGSLKQQYDSAGQSAFNNQIGRLSSLTGGRPSTAAVGTATAAQNDYAQEFTGTVLPSLIDQDNKRRQLVADNLIKQIGVLQGLGTDKYGQYRDSVGDYQTDRNYNRGVLESDRNYDRGVLESDRSYKYEISRDQILDDRYMDQFDYEKKQDIISNAMQSRQISISEGNAALSRAEFSHRKSQDAKEESTGGE